MPTEILWGFLFWFDQVIAILDRLKDENENFQDEDLENNGGNEENVDCDEEDDLDDGVIYVK